MSLGRILAMLIACAMLFAPMAMPVSAMVPGDSHMQMAADPHCGDQSPADLDPSQSCCVAMCVAIAPAPATAVQTRDFASDIGRASAAQFVAEDLAELATPPPRRA